MASVMLTLELRTGCGETVARSRTGSGEGPAAVSIPGP